MTQGAEVKIVEEVFRTFDQENSFSPQKEYVSQTVKNSPEKIATRKRRIDRLHEQYSSDTYFSISPQKTNVVEHPEICGTPVRMERQKRALSSLESDRTV